MGSIYKRNCNTCGEYYAGSGMFFCSMLCRSSSLEIRKKIGEANRKRVLSEGAKKKIGEANKRRIWSKDSLQKMSLTRVRDILSLKTREKMSNSHSGKKHSIETCKKISKSHTGVKRLPFTKEHRENISKGNTGKKLSLVSRINISEAKKGEKNPSWKGGVSAIHDRIRRSLKYRLWREAVFERDDWTCQECHQRGSELHADHIKPFAFYIELRFDINNGRTLCIPCHKKTETYGCKVISWMEKQKTQ